MNQDHNLIFTNHIQLQDRVDILYDKTPNNDELSQFFKKLQPNDDIKGYVITFLASMLNQSQKPFQSVHKGDDILSENVNEDRGQFKNLTIEQSLKYFGRSSPPIQPTSWELKKYELDIDSECGCVTEEVNEYYDQLDQQLSNVSQGANDLTRLFYHQIHHQSKPAKELMCDLIIFNQYCTNDHQYCNPVYLEKKV